MSLEGQVHIAEWSSSVARRAHNPEVAGSNPVSATKSVTVVDTISTTVIFYLFPFFRKCPAVDHFGNSRFICQVIKFLHHIQTELDFQRIGFVAALSFLIARLNHGKPFSPRDDLLHLSKKIFFLCPHLRQLVTERGQTYLFIHKRILPYWSTLYSFIFLCGVALTVEMFCPTVL